MCFPLTDPGVRPPPLSDLTLVWDKFLHRIDRNVYDFLKCLVFLTKSALHFATKLNSKAASFTIQEFKYTIRGQGIITCNCDWWERVWGCNLPQKSSTVLSEPKFGPPPPSLPFLDPPLLSLEISREFIKEQNIHSINWYVLAVWRSISLFQLNIDVGILVILLSSLIYPYFELTWDHKMRKTLLIKQDTE